MQEITQKKINTTFLFISVVITSALLLAGIAEPTKIDELHYFITETRDLNLFQFPYYSFWLFSNLSLIFPWIIYHGFGVEWIGFFNSLICCTLLYYLTDKNLKLYSILLLGFVVMPVNFIAEGNTGISLMLVFLSAKIFLGKKDHKVWLLALLAIFTCLYKISNIPPIGAIILTYFLVKRPKISVVIKLGLWALLFLILLSPEKILNGHQPLFPGYISETDKIILIEKFGNGIMDQINQIIKANLSSASGFNIKFPSTYFSGLKNFFFEPLNFPLWLLGICFGFITKRLNKFDLFLYMSSLILCLMLTPQLKRYMFGIVIYLTYKSLKKSIFVENSKYQLLSLLCCLIMLGFNLYYLTPFIERSLNMNNKDEFISNRTGGYELQKYYAEKLSSKGKIASLCFRDSYYFGPNYAPTFFTIGSVGTTPERFITHLRQRKGIRYFCHNKKLNLPGLKMVKKFNLRPTGYRNPFRKPPPKVNLYIYKLEELK